MAFAKDRDLLVLEPTLFRDVGWTGQRLLETNSASLSGTTLTVTGADFAALGVTAGHVVVFGGMALEVIARLSATSLSVSRVREDEGAPSIAPAAGLAPPLVVASFLPQIGVVHEQLLRAIGIEPSLPERRPSEADIVNPRALARLEALGALHLVYSAAAAMVGAESPMWMRARLYRERFGAERAVAVAEIDLDSDGVADALRRFNTIQFVRG